MPGDDSSLLPPGPPKDQAKEHDNDVADCDMDAARTLMSPPPEETLRARHQSTPRSLSITLTASNKRKRTQPDGHAPDSPMLPTTPTAKSRKQRRSQSPLKTLVLSPHAANPQADYLPATLDGKPRRRSQTPIPPYEPPPKESLTPAPKQVFVSPPPPSSSRRRPAHSRQSKAPAKIHIPIKKEMPEIDLNAPIPPASPTDDPLLLKGSTRSPRKLVNVGVGAEDTPIDVDALAEEDIQIPRIHVDAETGPSPTEFHFDVQPPTSLPNSSPPPSSPPAVFRSSSIPPVFSSLDATPDDDVFNDFSTSSADRSMEDDIDPADMDALPLPPARPPRASEVTPAFLEAANAGWESSDDEADAEKPAGEISEGESDYTGKWRTLAIRTKRDPPSAATIERMKRWGRPISPYPYARRRSEGGTSIVGEEDAAQREGEERQGDEEGDGQAPSRSPSPVSGPRQDLAEDRQQDGDELPEEVRRASTSRKASTSVTPAAPRSTTTPAAPPPGTPNQHLRSILRARSRSRTPGPSAMAAATPFTVREPSLPPLPESSPAVHQGGLMEALEAHRPREAASGMEDVHHGQEAPHGSHDMDRGDGTSEQTSVTPPESVAGRATTPEHSGARGAAPPSEKNDQPMDGWNVVVRAPPEPVVDDSDEEDESDEDTGPGCVVISSKDTVAAAKCIAILRQHNYDVMVREAQQRRRRASSTTALHDMSRASHRRSLLQSGVQKARPSTRSPFKKSASFTSLLSSPSAGAAWDLDDIRGTSTPWPRGPASDSGTPLTLTELLTVAEAEAPRCNTPSSKRRSTSFVTELGGDGEEDWTKDHWKLLDACFTRERISVALGGDDNWDPADASPPLADVDAVDLERVVDRFCTEAGGDRWQRDALLRRCAALSKKQKAGKVAPPTPSRGFRASSADPSSFLKSALFNSASARLPLPSDSHRFSTPVRSERSIVVPDFTPMSSIPALPRQPVAGTSASAIGKSASAGNEHGKGASGDNGRRAMSPALYNPRYSHLLNEAKSISRKTGGGDDDDSDDEDAAEVNRSLSMEPEEEEEEEAEDEEMPKEEEQEQPGGLKRFIYSYLPRSLTPSRRTRAQPKQLPQKALPPPPQLPPRGPIETPERPPPEPLVPPKELVELHQAPPPTKLPRPVAKPKRLVELQHVPTPDQWDKRLFNFRPRERKDSGGSVKDLIKSFEEIDRAKKAAADAKAKANGKKPAWK
ncbi:hypothetical protein FB107DRAFT_216139 [Schizophyllum commune]